MVLPALDAAEQLEADGIDCTVVNCRYLKPHDEAMLESLVADHHTLVTIEEGTVVNGFGAYLAGLLQVRHPQVRVVPLGVPDRLVEQAPRADQLELFGLTAGGIARRLRALHTEERVEAR
jgi:1-deoxy-D-xylulose-5-phosphate synthase